MRCIGCVTCQCSLGRDGSHLHSHVLTSYEKQPRGESLEDDDPLALVHAGDQDGDRARLQRRPHVARVVREALARLLHRGPEIS